MRYVFVFSLMLLGLTALPQAAQAYDGYASTNLAVRAGPGGGYPIVGRIGARTPVNIRGCVNGMKWCDVSARGFRGWVAGNYIRAGYRGRTSTVLDLGSLLGLPVVSFSERDYWGRNYYDRDFYRTRYGWNNDHYHYGWVRVDGNWRHSRNWRDYDYDHDGIPNRYDRDDDNDGIRDSRDHDDNNNGIRDSYERSHYRYGRDYRYNN